MKQIEKHRLLNDLVRDEDYLAFREQLFGRLVSELRQKRAWRGGRKLLALAACIALLFGVFLLTRSSTQTACPQVSGVAVVRTVPLHPEQIVATRSAKAEVTTQSPEVVYFTTARSEVEIVQTGSSPVQRLSDEQLLDLFKGRPVALVFVAPNERRLVLLDEQQKP